MAITSWFWKCVDIMLAIKLVVFHQIYRNKLANHMVTIRGGVFSLAADMFNFKSQLIAAKYHRNARYVV